jgi:ABC-type phosphate transport system substrate-binding protein
MMNCHIIVFRDQIRVVGSSTVFPYSQAAAEEYAKKTGKRAPVIESTGTGGGMKIFCQGIGPDHPDITGASRAMKKSEYRSATRTASPTSPSCRSASTACRSPSRARTSRTGT